MENTKDGLLAEGEAMPEDDDLDDEFEDFDDTTLVTDERWEDYLAVTGIKKKHPNLHLMKVHGFTASKFSEIEGWCREFCTGRWERINWYGSCSYTVILGFENSTDAIYYKLRWY